MWGVGLVRGVLIGEQGEEGEEEEEEGGARGMGVMDMVGREEGVVMIDCKFVTQHRFLDLVKLVGHHEANIQSLLIAETTSTSTSISISISSNLFRSHLTNDL